MYCTKCGTQINDNSSFCVNCGYEVCPKTTEPDEAVTVVPEPKSNMFINILSVFIPLVGLVYWVCVKDSNPYAANVAAKVALISTLVQFLIICAIITLSIAFVAEMIPHLEKAAEAASEFYNRFA